MGGAPQGGCRRRGAERQDLPRGGLPPLPAFRGGIPLLAARLPVARSRRVARHPHPAIPPAALTAAAPATSLIAVRARTSSSIFELARPRRRAGAGFPKDFLITLWFRGVRRRLGGAVWTFRSSFRSTTKWGRSPNCIGR